MPIYKKNILFPSILAGLAWIGVIATIFVLKPEGITTIIYFFALLFIAVYLTTIIFVSQKRRAFLAAFLVSSLLLLRYFHMDSIVNTILLVGLCATIEVYFISQKTHQ